MRREAITLVKDVYRIIADFPCNEIFPLTNQMRRVAIAVPSDINALLFAPHPSRSFDRCDPY
ncbi:MAG: four helix bundle protein [Gammaproteobacteria bacterium]|nr:four helix bundle protein [Gammaproteobacteria bacterium]